MPRRDDRQPSSADPRAALLPRGRPARHPASPTAGPLRVVLLDPAFSADGPRPRPSGRNVSVRPICATWASVRPRRSRPASAASSSTSSPTSLRSGSSIGSPIRALTSRLPRRPSYWRFGPSGPARTPRAAAMCLRASEPSSSPSATPLSTIRRTWSRNMYAVSTLPHAVAGKSRASRPAWFCHCCVPARTSASALGFIASFSAVPIVASYVVVVRLLGPQPSVRAA